VTLNTGLAWRNMLTARVARRNGVLVLDTHRMNAAADMWGMRRGQKALRGWAPLHALQRLSGKDCRADADLELPVGQPGRGPAGGVACRWLCKGEVVAFRPLQLLDCLAVEPQSTARRRLTSTPSRKPGAALSHFASLEEPCSADQQTQSHSNYISMRTYDQSYIFSICQSNKQQLLTPADPDLTREHSTSPLRLWLQNKIVG
jgi:hypothetical protein